MADPATVASNASCWDCVPNKEAAALYLLGQMAGITDPQTIAANAQCMDCIPNKDAAMIYLIDQLT